MSTPKFGVDPPGSRIMSQEELVEATKQLLRDREQLEKEKNAFDRTLDEESMLLKKQMAEKLEHEREMITIAVRTQMLSQRSTIGELPRFVPGKEDSWAIYYERLLFFFTVNNITDDSKRLEMLLTVLDSESYRHIRNALYPTLPQESEWDTVIGILQTRYQPSKNYLVERVTFSNRTQKPHESVGEFMSDLRGLSEHCKFENIDEALCSQAITGIRDEELKLKIFQTEDSKKLTFADILKMANAYETAKKHVQQLHTGAGMQQSGVYNLKNQNNQRYQRKHQGSYSADKKEDNGSSNGQKQSQRKVECFACKGNHFIKVCKYKNATCNYCKKKGHIPAACRKLNDDKQAKKSGGKSGSRGSTHYMEEEVTAESSQHSNPASAAASSNTGEIFDHFSRDALFRVSHTDEYTPPIVLPVLINDKMVNMEVDSGAGSTLIGYDVYRNLWPEGLKLHPVDRNLHTWSKELLHIKGCAVVQVEFNGKIHNLPLLVMFKSGPCILGRNWFQHLNINITYNNIGMCANLTTVNKVTATVPDEISEFSHMFSAGLGKYTGPPVSIELKEGATPIFRAARPVPYARVEAAEKRIDELVQDGYMSPVKHSEFATPVLFVTCSDGSLRMVGDYSSTVNPVCKVDIHPMPTVNRVLDSLSGGKYFTKLDLKRAFNQITVDDKSAAILTLNTSKGLFKVNRLSPGLTVAPAIFQRTISSVLGGAPGVISYIDDVLIQGKTKEELWDRTREVLKRLNSVGLKLNLQKCLFCVESLEFIGYYISGDGVKPTAEKVESLLKMPSPTDRPELQSFLGYVNYYDRFLENKATRFHPLYKLLQDGVPWFWGRKQEEAVNFVKKVMTSDLVLTPYSTKLPVVLSVDASPVGIGYVISHIMPDGIEKPIAFGSRTLRPAEKNYSQLDKEALAIIFGIKKFNQYLAGRAFTIYTDHKPLLGIFKPGKPISDNLSPRLTRWCLFLSGYMYKLVHRPGKLNGNADCLSRLPVEAKPEDEAPEERGVLLLEEVPENSALSAANIAKLTMKDAVLSKVMHIIQHGGDVRQIPVEYSRNVAAYSVSKGCVLYSDRVVIPVCLREEILSSLHKNHIGIEKMKQLARSYVYWPRIDQDIAKLVQSCVSCATVAKDPPKAPVTPWLAPQAAWSRLHIDFAGPYKNRVFLIIVDAFSKWIEVFDTKGSQSSTTVIKILRHLFATHGICDQLCSDNGPAFRSEEFRLFCENNLIKHVTISDYKAATNGQAERSVQTVKNFLSKVEPTKWEKELPNILLTLRTIPSSATGKSPAEMLFGRKLRTMWDKLHPLYSRESQLKREERVREQTEATKRKFKVDDLVWFRIYNKPQRWQAGVIIEVEGHRNFKILSEHNQLFRRHLDQLRKRTVVNDGNTSTDNEESEVQEANVKQSEPEILSPQATAYDILKNSFFKRFSDACSSVTGPDDSASQNDAQFTDLDYDDESDNTTRGPVTSTPKPGSRQLIIDPGETAVKIPYTPSTSSARVLPSSTVQVNQNDSDISFQTNNQPEVSPQLKNRQRRERRVPTYLKDYVLK